MIMPATRNQMWMPGIANRLLDAFGGLEMQAARVTALWEARAAVFAAAEAHRAEVARAQRESDWLRHAVDELAKLSPQGGEETTLAARRMPSRRAHRRAL